MFHVDQYYDLQIPTGNRSQTLPKITDKLGLGISPVIIIIYLGKFATSLQ